MKQMRWSSQLSRIGGIVIAVLLMTSGFWLVTRSTNAPVVAQGTIGGPLPNLTPLEITLFNAGLVPFTKQWDPAQGEGPVFTGLACNSCHNNPVSGGGSDIQKATYFGTLNSDGTFNPLTEEGGMLLQHGTVARFQKNCQLSGENLPADATIVAKHLAPPTFGSGLIDSVADSDILAQAIDKGSGVHGVANMVPDELGVTRPGRFGRKAQFVTAMQFSANALAHDMGITNTYVPDEDLPSGQPIPPNCAIAPEPNDTNDTNLVATYHYLMYLAPNTAGTGNANGEALFTSVGCALCHLPSYTTQSIVKVKLDLNGSTIQSKALSSQPVPLYSDLLLHDMGTTLQDQVPFGQATGTQWKTPPLWGLSLRTRYLHDGRATSLQTAIVLHGGEAATVVHNFRALSASDQADLISFISSL